jgi:hypothetical protein
MESGVSAYAAGVGLRRSTARTWSAVSLEVPLSQSVCTRGPQRLREDFVASSNSPLCRFVESLGCVLFACELEVDGLSARVEDAERLGGG